MISRKYWTIAFLAGVLVPGCAGARAAQAPASSPQTAPATPQATATSPQATAAAPQATATPPQSPPAASKKPIVARWKTAKWFQLPVLPSCQHFAVDRGNPRTGPFVVIVKMTAGCKIPWHWHSAQEEVMLASGTAKSDIKGMPTRVLHKGGYILLPAHHTHRLMCKTNCVFFDASAGAFDIHYVDSDNKEMPPGKALGAVKEKGGKAPPH